jgi:hypothetical protein
MKATCNLQLGQLHASARMDSSGVRRVPRIQRVHSAGPTLQSRMTSPGTLRPVARVRANVSEEHSVSFIRITRISELATTLAVTSNRRTLVTDSVFPSSPILVTLMMEALNFTETSVLPRATRRNIPEDVISHSRRREKLKSEIGFTCLSLPNDNKFTLDVILSA